ncbi:hypothetical protein HRM2_28490 [Desulforapulum autotrophicum HRM2]|uniref:Uncharacterized protein n=1 Tax=Desulforapulum autotrophicum (strain ATCC 43914 / DSM 3382 / VKM B-1955 / HRM2) TaxID=177437 RepID=C0QJC4_DESAH|nr:hypothetical protein HRM2_28490 [Desulforapulum autotrophicum HRM2]
MEEGNSINQNQNCPCGFDLTSRCFPGIEDL